MALITDQPPPEEESKKGDKKAGSRAGKKSAGKDGKQTFTCYLSLFLLTSFIYLPGFVLSVSITSSVSCLFSSSSMSTMSCMALLCNGD